MDMHGIRTFLVEELRECGCCFRIAPAVQFSQHMLAFG